MYHCEMQGFTKTKKIILSAYLIIIFAQNSDIPAIVNFFCLFEGGGSGEISTDYKLQNNATAFLFCLWIFRRSSVDLSHKIEENILKYPASSPPRPFGFFSRSFFVDLSN